MWKKITKYEILVGDSAPKYVYTHFVWRLIIYYIQLYTYSLHVGVIHERMCLLQYKYMDARATRVCVCIECRQAASSPMLTRLNAYACIRIVLSMCSLLYLYARVFSLLCFPFTILIKTLFVWIAVQLEKKTYFIIYNERPTQTHENEWEKFRLLLLLFLLLFVCLFELGWQTILDENTNKM